MCSAVVFVCHELHGLQVLPLRTRQAVGVRGSGVRAMIDKETCRANKGAQHDLPEINASSD